MAYDRLTSLGQTVPTSPVPNEVKLDQNYPNPFNPTTTIRYAVPRRSRINLTVFNTLAQQVAVLVDREVDAGYHEAQFDARYLSSGVYFYRLSTAGNTQAKKLLLLR
jgi:hypothetical protein